jgi:hypothetical protein
MKMSLSSKCASDVITFLLRCSLLQRQYEAVVGKPLDLNLTRKIRAEVVILILLVSAVMSFPFVALNGMKPWYGVPYFFCVLSCLLNTGLWRGKGLALVTAANRLTEELEQVSLRL